MLQAALTTKLKSITPNVFPMVTRMGCGYPAVVYTVWSTETTDDVDGNPVTAWMKVQVDIYDPDFLAGLTLAGTIRDAFHAWSDSVVGSAKLEDSHDMVDQDNQVTVYRVKQDYLIYAAL